MRGSSSRRGPQALLELTTWAERGYDLAITPDGPRGPRYIVQDGVMALAQITGLPIIPFSYHSHWKIAPEAGTAFKFRCPSPLRNELRQALVIPREAGDAERELLRQQLDGGSRSSRD